MSKLYLYSLFHLNLSFSAIPEADYPYVLKNCYSPLLDMAGQGLPVAIEASGTTLLEINRLSPSFIARLARLWRDGKCEFIGSGLSQVIMPLVPTQVNRWNLKYGVQVYEDLLGQRPMVALVNEQTYSRGVVDLFVEAGYSAIIMDWNNCYRYNQYPKDLLYSPQRARGIEADIDVLWNNSIAFQKLQRFVHGSLPATEYKEYLANHHNSDKDTCFVVYGNDAEVFDYRPGSGPLERNDGESSELERLKDILRSIAGNDDFVFTTPTELLGYFRGSPGAYELLGLESVESPLVCKKQEKYNPVRWAVTGRDSVHMNGACYGIYNNLELLNNSLDRVDRDSYRKTLCELWGSDFRTNTVDEKFLAYQNKMGWIKVQTDRLLSNIYGTGKTKCCEGSCGCAESRKRGLDLRPEDAVIVDQTDRLRIITPLIEVEFLKEKGFAISSLIFPEVSDQPLLGTLEHGYYDDIGYGVDYFSGHFIRQARDGAKTTDLECAEPVIEDGLRELSISVKIPLDIGTIFKTYVISKVKGELSIKYRLKVSGLEASSLRLGIFTFMPESFDQESLYYGSVNGGSGPENFLLQGSHVTHDEPVNQRVSASGCLGATEGWVAVGDKDKELRIMTNKSELYSVPMVSYRQVDDKFFLRLYHSIGEIDETAWWVWRGDNYISFKISAFNKD